MTNIVRNGLLIIYLLAGGMAHAGQHNEILMGSVAMDIPTVMHKRLGPLTSYLSETLGQPVRLMLSPNMKNAINEVASVTDK